MPVTVPPPTARETRTFDTLWAGRPHRNICDECVFEHLIALHRGMRRTNDEHRPKQTPVQVETLVRKIAGAGPGCGTFAQKLVDDSGADGLRALYGMLDLLRRYEVAAVDAACAFATSSSTSSLHFVRAYLKHHATPLSCRSEEIVSSIDESKAAEFRDNRTLDTFDWKFNALDRALIFELASGRFIEQREDVLLLGNAGVGKSHMAQAIGMAAIVAGFRVLYREAHVLFEDLLLAGATGERATAIATYSEIPLLIIDDLRMRKLPASAAEDLLEIIMRRYERASTILTSLARSKTGRSFSATRRR